MNSLPIPDIEIGPDRIIVNRLALVEPALASFVGQTPEVERAGLVERALRIGLLTLCQTGVSVNMDVIRTEFERLHERMLGTHEKAADALAATLREHFADRDGRLPRTLERFLGDSGSLQRMVADLFDENRRESAMGRLNDLLGRYFDGDASRLAILLDPTRAGSPLHQFRAEVTDEFRRLAERIEGLEEARRARAEERAKGTAKGGDFEAVLEGRLGDMARGLGDLLERTGTDGGDAGSSKKGDFVITIDPTRTRGADLRIVVEAKDRQMPLRRMSLELAEARVNRSAAVALAVFTPHTAPTSVAPLAMIGSDVYATHDPESADLVTLDAAYRAARILALMSLRDVAVGLDVEAVTGSLELLQREVEVVRGLKTKLTHIGSSAREVSDALDVLRSGVLRSVRDIEAQLTVVMPEEAALSA